MNVDEFQKKWGTPWATLIRGEMWRDALTVSDLKSGVFRVVGLDDNTIRESGAVLLAKQKGYALAVTTLSKLHEIKEFDFGALPKEDYPDPIKEHQEKSKEPRTKKDK